jgi:hypothetical protein
MKQETLKLPMASTWGEQLAALIMTAKVEHNKRGVPFTVRQMAAIIDAAYDALPLVGKTRRRLGGRDLIFDAIAEACGLSGELTRGAAHTIATAKRDILEATPDVTPDEIHRRARALRAKHPGAPFGPMGLAKHWSAFQPPRARSAINGPAGWLEALNKRFPESVYARGNRFEILKETAYEWARLPSHVRKELET